jgi:hypothetical protein
MHPLRYCSNTGQQEGQRLLGGHPSFDPRHLVCADTRISQSDADPGLFSKRKNRGVETTRGYIYLHLTVGMRGRCNDDP